MDAVMSQVVQVERDDDYGLLKGAPKNLHQIHGSLLMVELEAAGMLAQDLETLCSNISSAETMGEKARGLKVFRRGMEALQGYVDAIARQQPVSPLVLADQINNVRELIGSKGISSFDLFTPPLDLLDIGEEGYNGKPIPVDLRVRLVTQLRKKYRRALLKWLIGAMKGREGKTALHKISNLLQHLGKVSSLDVSRQLWWVASGFVDAVGTGELETANEIKSQFAKLDEEISRLEEESAANIATDPPDDLLRKMLFYIGSVEDTSSESINKIKQDLELAKWFGGMDADYKILVETSAKLEKVKNDFGPADFDDVEILVSESFAGYEGDSKDRIMSEFSAKLGKLSSSAETHGVEPIQKLVDNIVKAVETVDKSESSIQQTAADIKIASALLFLRDIVSNPDSIDVTWNHSVDSHQEELIALIGQTESSRDRVQQVEKIAQVEYQHARSAVVAQIRDTLSSVETSINMLRDGLAPESSLIEAVEIADTQMAQTNASLSMVGADSAATLGKAVREVINKLPTDGKDHKGSSVESAFEDLAYAIAALDVAADNISQKQNNSNQLLDTAADKLSRIDLTGAGFAQDTHQSDVDSEDEERKEFLETRSKMIKDLEDARQSLSTSDVSSASSMIKAFSALSNSEAPDLPGLNEHHKLAQLSQIGLDVTSQLASGDISLSADKEDFLGLLIRQLRETHGSVESDNVDVDAWEGRYAALLANEAMGQQAEYATSLAESPAGGKDEDQDSLSDSGSESGASAVETLDNDLKTIFVEEFGNHINLLQKSFDTFSNDALTQEEIDQTKDAVENCIHTLAGNCRNLGFDEAADCAEHDLTLLNAIQIEGEAVAPEIVESLREGLSLLKDAHLQIQNIGSYDSNLAARLLDYRQRGVPELNESDSELDISESGSKTALPLVAPDSTLEETEKTADEEAADNEDSATELDSEPVPSPALSEVSDSESSESEPQIISEESIEPSPEQQLKAITEPAEQQLGSAEQVMEVEESEIEDDIDEDIRQIFLEESETILNRLNGHLMEWRDQGVDHKILGGVRREFHTLKGSAAATGYTGVSGLSHSIESLLDSLKPDEDVSDSGLLELIEEMHDGLAADLGFVPTDRTGHIALLRKKIAQFLNEEEENEEEASQEITDATGQDVNIEADEVVTAESEVEDLDSDNDGAALLSENAILSTASSEGSNLSSSLEDGLAGLNRETTFSSLVEDDQVMNLTATNIDHLDADLQDVAPKFGGEKKSWTPVTSFSEGEALAEDESTGGSLRIASEKLAELINASGELGLGRTQLQNNLEATRMDLDLLRASMSSMREGLRDLEIEAEAQIRARPEEQTVTIEEEFDPLQLDRYSKLQAKSREVTELLDQLAKVERGLGNRTSNLSGALQQQQHLGQQLQSGLMSARMVAAADYVPRLRYLVRESARQAGKQVQLDFVGGEINVDRQVIESMMAPFEHMIRNAIAHGIETPEERKAAGKNTQAVIKIELNQQGTELVVDVSDDGRGLDVAKLSARAVELGMVETTAQVTEVDMLQVVTQPGFTTAEKISMESGRGVGMDVVYQAVRDLSGSMALNNKPGEGLNFNFRLPVTLAVTQALLVHVGQWQFALRSRSIYRLVRVNTEDIAHDDDQRFMTLEGEQIPLISVRQRLGDHFVTPEKENIPVVVVRLADRLAGFEVDEFGDAVDIVSKTAGRQLLSVPEFSGVTILGDNTVTMVLDPEVFFVRYRNTTLPGERSEQDEEASGLNRVLVVDDSLVVRKVMQRDLEADGLEVVSAIDGVNALEVLEDTTVDVALVDIEMPRMNGYELLEQLRKDSRYQGLPVIIITSRSGDQHKQRALSLGADGYITKPYNIGSLDALMRQVVDSRRTIH